MHLEWLPTYTESEPLASLSSMYIEVPYPAAGGKWQRIVSLRHFVSSLDEA